MRNEIKKGGNMRSVEKLMLQYELWVPFYGEDIAKEMIIDLRKAELKEAGFDHAKAKAQYQVQKHLRDQLLNKWS